MTERLAVLVDGDNVSGAYASRIAAAAREHGAPDVMRVYADAGCKSEWLSAPGFRMIHAGCGKNASDLLLAIDAMELALSNRLDRFVLVSSDGDFSHLALRLREYGYPVLGMGEVKAPASFRSACSSFAELAPIAVVAPTSTFDMDLCSGEDIPIEERGSDELVAFRGHRLAPDDIEVYNPVFDVTPAELIDAIVTEKGVVEGPNLAGVSRLVEKRSLH